MARGERGGRTSAGTSSGTTAGRPPAAGAARKAYWSRLAKQITPDPNTYRINPLAYLEEFEKNASELFHALFEEGLMEQVLKVTTNQQEMKAAAKDNYEEVEATKLQVPSEKPKSRIRVHGRGGKSLVASAGGEGVGQLRD